MRFSLRFLSLSVLLASCSTVRTVQPTELSLPHAPARVWVTRADQTIVVFDSARVSADSLIGLVDGAPERLPLSEAAVLRARLPSEAHTAALAAVVVGTAAAAVMYLAFSQSGSAGHHFPCNLLCPMDHPDCCAA
jgi:hypothetical protein